EVARVLAEMIPADGGDERHVPRSYLYRPSFAGRTEPLSVITACLDGAAEGRGACVLIAGESGAGKTRLATEIMRRASPRGFATAPGLWPPVKAVAITSGRDALASTFHPLLRAVADYCRLEGREATERLLGRRGKVLAAHEPALAELPGQAEYPEPAELAPDAAPARLLSRLTA